MYLYTIPGPFESWVSGPQKSASGADEWFKTGWCERVGILCFFLVIIAGFFLQQIHDSFQYPSEISWQIYPSARFPISCWFTQSPRDRGAGLHPSPRAFLFEVVDDKMAWRMENKIRNYQWLIIYLKFLKYVWVKTICEKMIDLTVNQWE